MLRKPDRIQGPADTTLGFLCDLAGYLDGLPGIQKKKQANFLH